MPKGKSRVATITTNTGDIRKDVTGRSRSTHTIGRDEHLKIDADHEEAARALVSKRKRHG